ncbi:hypothetical protein [Haloferax mucosum]|nr:hypothetical protein [Haloferax mucosum]
MQRQREGVPRSNGCFTGFVEDSTRVASRRSALGYGLASTEGVYTSRS